MCTHRELKMRRGYADVIYLLRVYNVRNDSIGHELLQTAIMSYLHNPNLEMNVLVRIAFENSPMRLSKEEECFQEMKMALQNVHAMSSKEVEDDEIVWKFIKRVASEVRMRSLVELRVISEDLEGVKEYHKSIFCRLGVRKISRPEDRWHEIINYCAGSYGYDDVNNLILDLHKVVNNEDNPEFNEAERELQELLETFVKEHENVIF